METLGNALQALVDSLLLFLQALDILSHLVNSDLQTVVLSILVVHGKQALVILLKVILPLFVQKLVLTDFEVVS